MSALNGDALLRQSLAFSDKLEAVKKSLDVSFPWYPYRTQSNFIHLQEIFNAHPLEKLTQQNRIADIGAADGDLAFFMQSLGFSVDIIDYGPTNFNTLKGARALVQALRVQNTVKVHEMDIDDQFRLPEGNYDLVFLLGILYHLKNPFYILEKLSKRCKHLILSTRVARLTPDHRTMEGSPLAYLVDFNELNNDATNYWIFSETALERLANRTGWNVMYQKTVGDKHASNPSSQTNDERAFMLLKSRSF